MYTVTLNIAIDIEYHGIWNEHESQMFSSACTNGRFSNDLEVWVRIIATRHVYNVVWPCALNVVRSCVSEFRPTAIIVSSCSWWQLLQWQRM